MITHENIEIVHHFLQVAKAPFKEMLMQLLAEYRAVYTPVRMVIFDAPVDNKEYVTRFACIKEAVKELFKEKQPSVSYVAQPPQTMGLVMEVHEVQLTEQSHGVFSRIAGVLETEGMPVSSIIRQWNYIEKITACDATGHQHYQDFNDARSLFYNGVEWITGYPAATGIGTQWGGIMIDVDALLCKDGSVRVLGVDNPLQIAAHAYSQNVLLGEKDAALPQKTTPKFERAKAVWKEDHGFVYVSGTAAIRGEQSLEGVGIEQQTLTTLENIEYLVSRDNLNRSGIPATEDATLITFRVYVKRWEDMEKAKQVVTERYPDLPAIYTLTDVCRSELLIEIEGMGILC